MRPLARALAGAGYRTLNLDYDSRRRSLDALSEQVDPQIAAFAAGVNGPLHFVTHSMGGLLVRVHLARRRPPRLGRVVMLGPPNGGSAVADLLHRIAAYRVVFGPAGQQLTTDYAAVLRDTCGPVDYELGIIAGTLSLNMLSSTLVLRGPNDGKVTVASTRLDGMADHIAVRASHTFMMRSPEAISATLEFLRTGRFR